jgi:hypothetical protein
MESSQFSLLSGPDLQAFGADHGAFGDVGAGLFDTGDLPTPDPYRLRLFSFVTSGADSESFTFVRGGTAPVFFGDGTQSTASGSISKTYDTSSVPSGSVFSVTTSDLFGFGMDTGDGASSIKNLNGLEFYWDALTNTTSNLKLQNLGINQPMPEWRNGTTHYTTINLKGNSIPGPFPSSITAGNVFIQGNKFTGELPSIHPTQTKKYQVQGNAFEGSIHDISSHTAIEAYLAYGQDNGKTYSRIYPKVMLTGEIPNLSGATALTFYHVGAGEPWNRGFKNDLSLASDFDVTNILTRFYASNCQLSTAEVDKILNAFANAGTTSPNIIDLSGTNGAPTSSGLADAASLVADGWDVNLPVGSGALPSVTYTVKGRIAGNASSATFSNGVSIDDDPTTYDLIIEVEAGGNVNLTYTSQNDFDEFTIDSGTVGSSSVGETNFALTNVQSNIECTITRTD